MSGLGVAVLLVSLATGAEGDEFAEAVDIYSCDFEAESDINFDKWPDRWTRRRGRAFPHFLKIAIEPETPENGTDNRMLQISLAGGAAAVYSPKVAVSPLYSYVFEARMKSAGLVNDVCYVNVSFFDDSGQRVGTTWSSPKIGDAPQWQHFRIGPIMPPSEAVRSAVVSLHLEPRDDTEDLFGKAMFDDIWIGQLPRMKLFANSPHHVFNDPAAIEVTCELSGIADADPQLTFELLDVNGQRQNASVQRLEGEQDAQRTRRADGGRNALSAGHAGRAVWRPPIEDYGFYRVRVSMKANAGTMLRRDITLAVIPPLPGPAQGEFGWTLPDGDKPLEFSVLIQLLPQMGINWVKFPVWYSNQDYAWADRLAWFAERLNAHNIELVGMLDEPPTEVQAMFGRNERLPVASVFVEPELWKPVIDPVMTRLSLSVRWWQLGADDDTSFVGFPNLNDKIAEIKSHLKRFGQEVRLGVGWRWMYEPPVEQSAAWDFLSFTERPQFSHYEMPSFTMNELDDHLAQHPGDENQRWIVLNPLPRDQYDVPTRARDLVGRMLAAKMQNAAGVFVSRPFDDRQGLLNSDGTPGELLIPWQTTARMVSGAKYVGSLQLPNGSPNHLFQRGDETIMVVWNEQPTTETIYLGEFVRQVDLWGRDRRTETENQHGWTRQRIEVGPMPVFVVGLNLAVARWRMACQFETDELASIFGREQTIAFNYRNFFPQGVGGRIDITVPAVWDATPRRQQFKLARGEAADQPLRVVLRADASSGPQPVRLDFDVTAERNYRFSVYRTISVGLEDILLDVVTRMDRDGNLVVEQLMTNKTDEFVSFNCLLFVPSRKRYRKQVINLGRGQTNTQFVLRDGKQLRGKSLWLRAEEIGGARILNYRFDVVH